MSQVKEKINLSYEGTIVEEVSTVVPYCQLLNPIRHTSVGIAIKKEQAILAGFNPDKGWGLKKILLGDDETECYINPSPRMVILWSPQNAAKDVFMVGKDGDILPFDPSLKSKGYKTLSYCVVAFLGEDNSFLSNLPFRLKVSSLAGKSLLDSFKDFSQQLRRAYVEIQGDGKGFSSKPGIFSPKFVKGVGQSPDGSTKIPISLVESFLPISANNIVQNYILPSNEVFPQLVEISKDWCNLLKVKEEYNKVEKGKSRNDLLGEIAAKFESLKYSFEEKGTFFDENFDGKSLPELSDKELEQVLKILEVESGDTSVIPF